ncbi:hypothetical protein SS50377_23656 [Spironucleus salmonicida]|uniref:Uncharacterized protein n=1 Tax=Spironucleus salmonicida TaxID=348837 RepID=V6M5J9_9EUKA|nr:hypothetical protein SS50377_23656 [Spironucleus salmonicida]|eukprot:EST48639.1 hypothetical protein SS50377_11252 [Spironucleus salmonicida]
MSKQMFFKGVGLNDIKRVQQLYLIWENLCSYGVAIPSPKIIQNDEAFLNFIKGQAKDLKIPQKVIDYALNLQFTIKEQLIPKSKPKSPHQDVFTPLCTKVEKMYARSTQKPDPCEIRTPNTLHKAVLIYHAQFDALKDHLQPQRDYFCGDYIKFRSQMRAVRFDYSVQGLTDQYLVKANYDALRAAALVQDLKEILALQGQIRFGKSEKIMNLALFIEFYAGQAEECVQMAVIQWAQGKAVHDDNRYVNAVLALGNAKFVL